MSSRHKSLCLALMKADQEEDVIRLLTDAGYWDSIELWRPYGDTENNFSTAGNQSSRPEAALVEKIINSIDAKLILACQTSVADPEGPDAPRSLGEAVSRFFSPFSNSNPEYAGKLKEWTPSQRTEVARGITLAITGNRPSEGSGYPCFTIADNGEGQSASRLPETILSLDRKNKQSIPFVQGRFNMGGTGALRFCGRHNLQLVVTKRHPAFYSHYDSESTDSHWAFTVVRRIEPTGIMRNSVYVYLAPLEGSDGKGQVLSFESQTLSIFPKDSKPYMRDSEWGTLIKMYEYAVPGARTHMFMKGGMLERLDLLLPEIGLPIRLHECRKYRGKKRSVETTLSGLSVRLDDNRADNLEDGFPSPCPISADGQKMVATIYAFKKRKAETYRRSEGIVFTFNGQSHGHMTKDFFGRGNVKMDYLANDILVIVDCTDFDGRAREDFLMNSRDRLSRGALYSAIQRALEDLIKNHPGLRELRERRRREEIANRLDNSKPLADVLNSILKRSPSLAALFLQGRRLSAPFKTKKVTETDEKYHGQTFPTYFKPKGHEYNESLLKECHINMRFRVTFETDAVNDYFRRAREPGTFHLSYDTTEGKMSVTNYVLNMYNGVATLSVELPSSVVVGSTLRYISEVTDETRIEPFRCVIEISVLDESTISTRSGKKHRKSPDKKDGDDRDAPLGIQLPNVREVREEDWDQFGFDAETALMVRSAGTNPIDGEEKEVFDFYVNIDNIHLKTHLKTTRGGGELATARFKYALVLLGLGMLHDSRISKIRNSDGEDTQGSLVQKNIARFTKAVSPIILPMIDSLGGLDINDIAKVSTAGEPAE